MVQASLSRWLRPCTGFVWLLLCLGGCASVEQRAPIPSSGVVYWQQGQARLPADLVRLVETIQQRLQRVAAIELPLRIDSSPAVNAFAQRRDGGGYEIVLNAGLIDMVGYDQDQLAFVIAHEISHVTLGHLSDEQIAARRQESSTVELISMLADVVIPMSGLALSAGHKLREAGYSREQEIAADSSGVRLMRESRFDLDGALRFQRLLLTFSNPSQLNLLSSHPPGVERLQALAQQVDDLAVR